MEIEYCRRFNISLILREIGKAEKFAAMHHN